MPGELVLNDCKSFKCKKVKCNVNYKDINETVDLYKANSYGKYINKELNYIPFLKYNDNTVAGICNLECKIFGHQLHNDKILQ